jgi:integrase
MKVNVVRRGDTGSYRVKLTAKDSTGRWTTKWVKGAYSEAEAQLKKREIEANIQHGTVEHLDSATVAGYLSEWVSDRHASGRLGISSVQVYKDNLKRINRYLGTAELGTITHREIQDAYRKLAADYGLNAAVQSHRVFSVAMKDAVRAGRLLHDPMARVTKPVVKVRKKKSTLTPEDVHAAIQGAKDPETRRAIHLLAATGMRIGELCALKWEDFDFARNKITVDETIARLPGRKVAKAPKTEAGNRVISVTPEDMALFELLAGEDDERVFKTWDPHQMSQKIGKVLAEVGLGRFTTHDLRHAHATFMLKRTPNPKIVSKRLGHSDVRVTLTTYSHVLDGDDEELAALSGGLLNPTK